jgi:hypothetical protein
MNTDPHLSIELVWEDFDLEQLGITAGNGAYCGSAKVYFSHGEIGALAEKIRGFPKTASQVESFGGGSDDGPRARLTFRCVDHLGHAVVRVSLADFAYASEQPPIMDDVNLELRFDAAALDEFCKELEAVAMRTRKRAVLRGLVS